MNLPVVETKRKTVSAKRVHLLRLAVIAMLVMLLPSPHGSSIVDRWFGGNTSKQNCLDSVPTFEEVRSLCPTSAVISAEFNEAGLVEVFDPQGVSLGSVARTFPNALSCVGYRGPTEALVWINPDQKIEAVGLVRSHDTQEHVQAVVQSKHFFEQFVGIEWGRADGGRRPTEQSVRNIDGVSGATLTSLALARGVFARMGDQTSQSVFSKPLDLEDARRVLPNATRIDGDPAGIVWGSQREVLGTLLRTGGFLEDEPGYQGPSELLIAVGADGRVVQVALRKSYDNSPYVDYLSQERSFFSAYQGMTLSDLANDSHDDLPVEGVSGATMTSQVVAEMIPKLARSIESQGEIEARTLASPPWRSIRFRPAEVATLVMLIGLAFLMRFGAMRYRKVRIAWLVAVIVVIGWWAGNLVSLSLLFGMVTSGFSWEIAIGLAALVLVTLVWPPATKTNPYCHHLCPHGAMQQLIRPTPRSKRHRKLPKRLANGLRTVPAILLSGAYLLLLFRPAADVTFIEPFHAYLWRVSTWSAIGWAVTTLVFSAVVPMGYCRYGCPTGRFLQHVRFKATSHRITALDISVFGMLLFAIAVRTWIL